VTSPDSTAATSTCAWARSPRIRGMLVRFFTVRRRFRVTRSPLVSTQPTTSRFPHVRGRTIRPPGLLASASRRMTPVCLCWISPDHCGGAVALSIRSLASRTTRRSSSVNSPPRCSTIQATRSRSNSTHGVRRSSDRHALDVVAIPTPSRYAPRRMDGSERRVRRRTGGAAAVLAVNSTQILCIPRCPPERLRRAGIRSDLPSPRRVGLADVHGRPDLDTDARRPAGRSTASFVGPINVPGPYASGTEQWGHPSTHALRRGLPIGSTSTDAAVAGAGSVRHTGVK
jgi:hypothetical protein